MTVWAIIAAVFGALLAICWPLLALATNSHIRAQAQQHPNSITYWYIMLADRVLAATIFRPLSMPPPKTAQLDPVAPIKSTAITSLHAFADLSELVSIRQSFTVSIDLTRSIPPTVLRYLGNPLIVFAANVLICLGGFIAALLTLSRFMPMELALIVALVFALSPLIWIMLKVMTDQESFVPVMMQLWINSYLVISIDDRLIATDGSWGKIAGRNTSEFRFTAETGGFNLSLNRAERIGETPRTILSYPRFLANIIMDESQLDTLCKRLNDLAAKARNLPKVQYEEIQV